MEIISGRELQPRFIETARVRFGDVDRSDRLSPGSIFNFFQEAAISHAEHLGVGRDAMVKTGQAWVLSRVSIFIEKRPAYEELIEVSTWPRGWEKLFAFRDYTIRDANGFASVRGRGSWLVLDIEKRRPLRVQSMMEALPINDGHDAMSKNPPGLEIRDNLQKVAERSASYSDVDYYGHMNNARYVQWIQDAADIDILTSADQIRLDINYLNEVKPKDNVELWAAPIKSTENEADYPSNRGSAFAFEGRRESQAVFRAELFTGKI